MGAGDQAAGGAGWVWGPLRGSRAGPARLPQQIQESGGPLVELLAASVSGGPLASSSAVPAWSLGGVLLQWASVESRRWTGPEDTPSSGCVRLGRPPPPGSHPRRISLVVSAKPRLVFVDRPLPHSSEAPPGWVAPVLQKRKLKLRRVTWVRRWREGRLPRRSSGGAGLLEGSARSDARWQEDAVLSPVVLSGVGPALPVRAGGARGPLGV